MAPSNTLPVHGNEKTMNLNNMILTNIQSSPYFKVNLFELKTYHEVVDEIYYKVTHLEPWEKGSRKTAGQTGMCGGVRGVGAGGIVSSAYCLLYKLYTLKLTRKQLNGLLTHSDSCFIRGLGFMYIRYTQPPADLWEWYEPYLADEEEIDVKAGGGHSMMIGEMVRQFLTKLEWYSTLFPRIPVPVQKSIETHLMAYEQEEREQRMAEKGVQPTGGADGFGEAERQTQRKAESPPVRFSGSSRRPTPPFDIAKEFEKPRKRSRSHSKGRSKRSRSKDRKRRSRSREKKRSRSRERRSRSRDRHHRRRSRSRERRHRSRSPGHHRHKHSHRSRSRERGGGNNKHSRDKDAKHRESSFERDLRRERDRVEKQRRGRDRNGSY